MNELELQVLQIIRDVYEKEYVGKLKVTQTENGYILRLYLNKPDNMPILIAADLNAEDFLKYVRQELKSRQLQKINFYKGVKIYPEDAKRGTC